MQDKVPITFDYHGQTYSGLFTAVTGSGAAMYQTWHLMINNFYNGQLHYSQASAGWVFHSNSGRFDDLSDYFEAYMVGWFQ